jgi:hypothetical protein
MTNIEWLHVAEAGSLTRMISGKGVLLVRREGILKLTVIHSSCNIENMLHRSWDIEILQMSEIFT